MKILPEQLLEEVTLRLIKRIDERDLARAQLDEAHIEIEILKAELDALRVERDLARTQLGDIHMEIGTLKVDNECLNKYNDFVILRLRSLLEALTGEYKE